MDMRSMVIVVGVIAIVLAGCFHRSGHALRIGDQVVPPQGLDSIGTVKWIAQQRAACPGNLLVLIDRMSVGSLDGTPVPYHSDIAAVMCTRP